MREWRRAAPRFAPVHQERPLPDSSRGGVVVERKLLLFGHGDASRVHLEQRFRGTGRRAVVAHGASLWSDVVVVAGALRFPLASGRVIEAPPRFTLVVPAGAFVPMAFEDAHVEARGYASFAPGARDHGGDGGDCSPRVDDIVLDVDGGAAAPWLARARKRLHGEVAARAPVRTIARELGVAEATLTRAFTRHYGIGPKEYVQRARVFRAVLALLFGAAVVDAAFFAGFSDVSRFYAQFRRIVGATPGAYARPASGSAKTSAPSAVHD